MRSSLGLIGALLVVGAFASGPFVAGVAAHDGVVHKTAKEAADHAAETAGKSKAAPSAGLPFPVDIQAKFALIDHDGRAVTEQDYAGKTMAIFFGYASCPAICSVAMPRLGAALDLLGDKAANSMTDQYRFRSAIGYKSGDSVCVISDRRCRKSRIGIGGRITVVVR